MTVATRSGFSAAASRPCRAHGAVNASRPTLQRLCDDSHAAEVLHELFAISSYPTVNVPRIFVTKGCGGCLVHLLQPRSKRCCTPKASGASVARVHGVHRGSTSSIRRVCGSAAGVPSEAEGTHPPVVVPISYAYDGEAIYGHGLDGLKVRMMRERPAVCFQIDRVESVDHWRSVIAGGGRFQELTGAAAMRALQMPHVAGTSHGHGQTGRCERPA
jgi:hypothetical protein